MRRLIGKFLIHAGPLQTGRGAIHAIRDKFADDKTEGSLLVDAENAFNKLNRTAALENIKVLL